MSTTIGIIGAGNIGQAVARRISNARLEASISNSRGPESLVTLVRELGPGIKAATRHEAASADIVFLAVPWTAHAEVVSDLPPWNGRIVIDAMNAASFGPKGVAPLDLGGRPSSEVVAGHLPGARVVKAFNTLTAAVLASDPRQSGGQRVMFMSGADQDAKAAVAELIGQLGFAPIDLGDFETGRRVQQFPGGALAAVNFVKF
jgi:8-hydroxy-5-deazaflavin:NADPH oxidoreductase